MNVTINEEAYKALRNFKRIKDITYSDAVLMLIQCYWEDAKPKD